MPGSLCVVGTGIKSIAHVTTETRLAIVNADKVLYLVADFLTQDWIVQLNPMAEDLHRFYGDQKPRAKTYEEMTAHILSFVHNGYSVCAAFYGHPGVFAAPSHAAVRQARAEGFTACMLPGISAEDCMFADLGIDPARSGCQSFETTDFLLYERKFDTSCHLVLWQVGVIGNLDYRDLGYDTTAITTLVSYLLQFYPAEHAVTVYEGATYEICHANVKQVALQHLGEVPLNSSSTLYISPLANVVYAKPHMIKALNIPLEHVTVIGQTN